MSLTMAGLLAAAAPHVMKEPSFQLSGNSGIGNERRCRLLCPFMRLHRFIVGALPRNSRGFVVKDDCVDVPGQLREIAAAGQQGLKGRLKGVNAPEQSGGHFQIVGKRNAFLSIIVGRFGIHVGLSFFKRSEVGQ